ncbi:MAG: DNA cytosine methyltransferase [Sandaracinaceae bacterium]|nr:DNA cytosine methyltransferase [Sandaracinaceae bacterium]
MSSMGHSPKTISLYTGAGGLDFGFEAAGFRTRAAIEMDADACATMRHNDIWPVVERSIYDVSSEEILDVAKLVKGEADVLIGGPPCQPFSKSGTWKNRDTKRLSDPRASTLNAYMRVVEDTLPKAILLENVEGLAYKSKSEGLQFLKDQLATINKRAGTNYRPHCQVLLAADYGVPQLRSRFFLIAGREGQEFVFPKPTHGEGRAEAHRTAWDALGDVEPEPHEDLAMRGRWADLLPTIPEGENYLFHTDRGHGEPLFGWRRRYWSFLLKLSKRLPSWTVQSKPGPAIGPFHWDNRRLAMRELCRIQTFPDDIKILGVPTVVQKQVGNAVPSLLAEILAREIRVQLLGRGRPRGGLKLLPPVRMGVPPAEATTSLPRKFWHLRGDHSAHPGTGKGFGALAEEQFAAEQLELPAMSAE